MYTRACTLLNREKGANNDMEFEVPDDATPDEIKEAYDKAIAKEFAELATYREALQQEFKGKNLDDPETATLAKETVLDLVPDAASQVRWLIQHADSENIRKDLSKWVLDLAMKRSNSSEESDALDSLIKSLQKTPVNDQ